MTTAPYTSPNSLSAARSLSTPFCRQAIGVSSAPARRSAASAPAVSWLLVASSTTSSAPRPSSDGSCTAASGSTVRSTGVSSVSPERRIASRCAPRAISATSWPLWCSRAPTTPPIAPAPKITKRIGCEEG